MKNLVIDVGNSLIKLAVFKDGELLSKAVIKPEDLKSHVDSLVNKHPTMQKAIIASVGKLEASHLAYLEDQFEVFQIQSWVNLPFKNSYKTPLTLGADRIALISASIQQYPYNNVLIIDAGTCITYDFVTSDNEYLGGAISPGIKMRYQSLHNLTANLPLLHTEAPKNMIGQTTNDCIHSGVVLGVVNEIDGAINEYQEKYKDLTVILTGGDANFLSKQLKSSIFANSNFLLEGLNFILQFNSNE